MAELELYFYIYTSRATTNPYPSKRCSKCTTSVDPLPVYSMGLLQYLAPVIRTSTATASAFALVELYLFPTVTVAPVCPKMIGIL